MAEVHIVDIDGEQWDIKDLPLTDRVANLETKVAKNFEYSTTEQEIGKWLDGKKHYRLTIAGSTTTRSASINLTDKNIANITKINGTCIANGEYIYPIPYFFPYTQDTYDRYYAYVNYDLSRKVLDMAFGLATYFNNVTFNIEIEYTKNS